MVKCDFHAFPEENGAPLIYAAWPRVCVSATNGSDLTRKNSKTIAYGGNPAPCNRCGALFNNNANKMMLNGSLLNDRFKLKYINVIFVGSPANAAGRWPIASLLDKILY